MADVTVDSAGVAFNPSDVIANREVQLIAQGFLADAYVNVNVLLPDGSQFDTRLRSDASGRLNSQMVGKPASATVTLSGNPSNNNTITIDGVVYTFKSTLTPAANEILIVQPLEDAPDTGGWGTLLALKAAINGEPGSYGEGTEMHETVGAAFADASNLRLYARDVGTDGNSLAISKSGSAITLSGSTLAGGEDAADNSYFMFRSAQEGLVKVTLDDGSNKAQADLRVWGRA